MILAKERHGVDDMNNNDLNELKECVDDGSLYFYLNLDGVEISSKDPVIGNGSLTALLSEQSDHQPKRKHPFIGERLDCYAITNHDTGEFRVTPSDWVVFHVEVFPGSQLVREVVVAWCRKEPIEVTIK